MCEHKNLKTVNDRLFCKDCGQNLPMDFLTGTVESEQENLEAEEILEDKLAEEPAEPEEPTEAPQEVKEQGENTPDSAKTGKTAQKKTTSKTTRKTAKKGE